MYCLVLVCVGVGEAFDLAGFTSEEAVEVGSDLVTLAFAEGVTLRASCLREVLDDRPVCSFEVSNEAFIP